MHRVLRQASDGVQNILLPDRDEVRAVHHGILVQSRGHVIGMLLVDQELRRLTGAADVPGKSFCTANAGRTFSLGL